jgi:hypothetical protein
LQNQDIDFSDDIANYTTFQAENQENYDTLGERFPTPETFQDSPPEDFLDDSD